MSHFTCLVTGDNPEELLAPYDENTDVEPYRKDIPQEDIDRMVEYYTKGAKEEDRIEGLDASDLTTLQPYWHGWSSSELLIDEDGKPYRMCTYNPESQWDWYQMGGRYQGMLRLKHGTEGVVGEASLMFEDHEYEAKYADQAKMADIDWQYMRNDPDKLLHLKLQWEEQMRGGGYYKPGYYVEKYGNEKEFFRQNLTFSTFAAITADGVWHEVGKMGWWAMSTETHDENKTWVDHYWEAFLEDLDDDALVTIFDLHI